MDKKAYQRLIAKVNAALKAGYCPPGMKINNEHKGAIRYLADQQGVHCTVIRAQLKTAKNIYKLEPNWALWKPKTELQKKEFQKRHGTPDKPEPVQFKYAKPALTKENLLDLLKKSPLSIPEIEMKVEGTASAIKVMLDDMEDRGINIHCFGDKWSVSRVIAPQRFTAASFDYRSRKDNTFVFGFTSDNHLGSKYERLDVLHELYDWFAIKRVDRVFNAGNWIEGEARFNKFDIHVYGMENQIDYLVANYPQRKGITTYAVAGDDHEGWYSQKEGVNIGRFAERSMREAGRYDWVDMGYQEAYANLVNANSGMSTTLLNTHPGGGSAYATSYKSQKAVEAFEGGEKPAILLQGHYHKLLFMMTRSVWVIQTGCTKDQDSFMRKNMISAHIGGGIASLTQDPITGAITNCAVEFKQWFNRGHYNNRFSHSGKVNLPDRATVGT